MAPPPPPPPAAAPPADSNTPAGEAPPAPVGDGAANAPAGASGPPDEDSLATADPAAADAAASDVAAGDPAAADAVAADAGAGDAAASDAATGAPATGGSEPAEPPWQLTPTPPWPPAAPAAGPPPPAAPPPVPPAPPHGYPSPPGPPPVPGAAPAYPVQPAPAPGAFAGPAGFGPAPGPVVVDPHGLGLAVSRLSGGARRAGKVALAVLSAVLDEGDVVAIVVQGRFRAEAAVAALVEGKVVIVNDRQWKPDVVVLPVDADMAVHGWQHERTAALTFMSGDRQEVLERIGDRGLAIEMAQRVRHAVGGPDAAPPVPPAPPAPPPPMPT